MGYRRFAEPTNGDNGSEKERAGARSQIGLRWPRGGLSRLHACLVLATVIGCAPQTSRENAPAAPSAELTPAWEDSETASRDTAARSAAGGSEKGMDMEAVLNSGSGQFRALLVGVNDYERLTDLRYCEEDVSGFRDRLVALGLEASSIKCLTTGADDAAYRPNVRNITERLDAMFSGLREDAVLIISFSGHGGSFEWKDGSGRQRRESFFCAQDARLDDPMETMISVQSIYERLEQCPARFKMLLVDACRDRHLAPPRARTAVDEAKSMAEFAKSLSDRRLPRGTLAMVSCSSGEKSYEDPKLEQGIFMHYVLEALAGRADHAYRGNRDRVVSYREFKDYVYRKTSDHAWSAFESPQTPNFHTEWELENFGLVKVRGPEVYTEWPFDANEAKRRQRETAETLDQPEEITNSIGMTLKLIPAGEFLMGSPENEDDRDDDEGQHRVRLTQPFYLGETEVTQAQWEAVMGTSLSDLKKDEWHYAGQGSDTAMYWVSWYDAIAFCNALSERTGREPYYELRDVEPEDYGAGIDAAEVRIRGGNGYRLPTEPEWEYACRAGTDTAYSFGDDPSKLDDYAWFEDNAEGAGEEYAHEVGRKRANDFGLYDMHGNVWEWCADWYDSDYYGDSPTEDPSGPTSGSYRVFRGGSWYYSAGGCRSAYRGRFSPGFRITYCGYGFRVALVAAE